MLQDCLSSQELPFSTGNITFHPSDIRNRLRENTAKYPKARQTW